VLAAVPLEALATALEAARPHLVTSQVVMDASSVKVKAAQVLAAGAEVPWAGTHPLFGPSSVARGEPLRAVVCPSPAHPAAAEAARALYERLGCEVRLETPEAHDARMAWTHALPSLVGRALLRAGAPEDATWAPPSYRGVAQVLHVLAGEAPHLLESIQHDNPYAAEARRKLLAALDELNPTPGA
jgi:prephenate dehydrogenase